MKMNFFSFFELFDYFGGREITEITVWQHVLFDVVILMVLFLVNILLLCFYVVSFYLYGMLIDLNVETNN